MTNMFVDRWFELWYCSRIWLAYGQQIQELRFLVFVILPRFHGYSLMQCTCPCEWNTNQSPGRRSWKLTTTTSWLPVKGTMVKGEDAGVLTSASRPRSFMADRICRILPIGPMRTMEWNILSILELYLYLTISKYIELLQENKGCHWCCHYLQERIVQSPLFHPPAAGDEGLDLADVGIGNLMAV